jgi:hypothetical protein
VSAGCEYPSGAREYATIDRRDQDLKERGLLFDELWYVDAMKRTNEWLATGERGQDSGWNAEMEVNDVVSRWIQGPYGPRATPKKLTDCSKTCVVNAVSGDGHQPEI